MSADHFVFDTKETKILLNPSEILFKEGEPALHQDTSFFIIENNQNLDAQNIGWDIYPIYYLVVNKKSGFYYFPDPRKRKTDLFIETLKTFKEPKLLSILSYEGEAEGVISSPELSLKLSDGFELKQDLFYGEVRTHHNISFKQNGTGLFQTDISEYSDNFPNGVSDNLKHVGSGVQSDKVIQFFYAWKRGDYGKSRPSKEQQEEGSKKVLRWFIIVILFGLVAYQCSGI